MVSLFFFVVVSNCFEIRTLLKNAKLDFDELENRGLNDYLLKILHSCPFTEEVCTTNQCQECSVFKKKFK